MAVERRWFEIRHHLVSGRLYGFATGESEVKKLAKMAIRKLLGKTANAFVDDPIVKKVGDIPMHDEDRSHSYVIKDNGKRIPLFH